MVVPIINPYQKNPYRKRPRADLNANTSDQISALKAPATNIAANVQMVSNVAAIPAIRNEENNVNNFSFDDDGGIDWDLVAFDKIEQIHVGQQPPSNQQAGRDDTTKPPVMLERPTNQQINVKNNTSKLPEMLERPTKNQQSVKDNTGKPPAKLERPAEWSNHPVMLSQQSQPTSSQQQQQQPVASTTNKENDLPRLLQYSSEKVQPIQDDLRKKLVKNARLSDTLKNGWTLFSHQKKAILRALLMRRIVLALDMGLGKTLIGAVWARSFRETYGEDKLKVICICPVSLSKEWKRTSEEVAGLEVEESKKGKKTKEDPDSTLMSIHSWAKIPDSVPPSIENYVVVCDEAHCMQSLAAARTKQVLKLTNSERCVGVLLLTGTPMKNGKPANLFPLLKAVNHPFGDHRKAYESHFCDGHEKNFGQGRVVWDANGCSNLGQLKKHISSHLLHMTKEQCMSTLPPKTRTTREVQVSSRHQLQHNQALNELAQTYANRHMGDSGDAVLGKVARVRQIGSFAKVDATVAIAKEILQDQPAVVIFTSFATVAKEVYSKLASAGWVGELLTGETPAKKRQDMVDNFQEGLSPVFVSTFGAGGVGLTLTAAHTIILLDRPWTPGDANQAEDRVRRIGQTKPVTSIWMEAFELDKQIDILLQKKENATQVVLADGDEGKLGGAAKLSIMQLLKSVLGNATTSTTRQTTLM